jgi:hypothetical protein
MLCVRLRWIGLALLASLCLGPSSVFASGCMPHSDGDCVPTDACGDVVYGSACRSAWFASVDALILTRDNASNPQTVVQTDSTGAPVLTTQDLNFGWDAGPRVFFGGFLTKHSGFEVGYFGIQGGDATASATDPNNLDIPPPLSAVANDFDNANSMTLTYNWRINNAEVNLFEDWGHFQVLGGFRYFNLDEQFNIRTQDADGDVSDYHINSRNNLYGGQMGARFFYEGCKWGIGGTGKAGVYGNSARQRQTVRDNDNTTLLRNARGDEGVTSFIGDLDLYATYKINDHWRVRGGYYLLWISDLALAPDQLDFSFNSASGTGLNTDGHAFFHGATVGIEAGW